MKVDRLFPAAVLASAILCTSTGLYAQTEAGGRAGGSMAGSESTYKPKVRAVAKHTVVKRTTRTGKTAAQYEADGSAFFDQKDYDSALAAYQSAVNIKPSAVALYRIGWIQNDFGEFDKALLALNRASALDPSLSSVFLEKGYALRRLKRLPEAAVALKRCVELNPQSALGHYEFGLVYFEQKQYAGAVSMLTTATSLNPDSGDAFEQLGISLRMLGRNAEAIDALNRAIELNPEDSGGYMGLGDAYYYGTKDYAKAVDAYVKGLQYQPDNDVAAYNVGWASNDLGNYDDAIKWLNECLRIKPNYSPAYTELGYANYKLKQDSTAMNAYQKALQIDPRSSSAYFGIGDIYYYNQKNYVLAAEKYKSGLAIKPDDVNALYRIGYCYNDQELYQEAIDSLSRAKQLKPDYAPTQVELGYAYYKLNRYAEAASTFKQASAVDRTNQLAHYYLGLVYVATGDRNGAMAEYRALQQLSSDYASKLLASINK